jgi:hypothetical protein
VFSEVFCAVNIESRGLEAVVKECKEVNWLELPLSNAPLTLRILMIVGLAVGFCGLVAGGYCDHEQRLAFSKTPTDEFPAPSDYKGETRFVSPIAGRICKVSFSVSFGGIGSAILLGFVANGISYIRWKKRGL